MPKVEPTFTMAYPSVPYKLKNFVYEYGEEVFKVNDNELFCLLCECKVRSQPKRNVILHLTSEKYSRATKRHQQKKIEENKQFRERQQEKMSFNIDLFKAFTVPDIPLSKLSEPILR